VKASEPFAKKPQLLQYYRFEGEALLGTGPAAGLAADAVPGIFDFHEHLGRIVFVQLFEGKHVMDADLVAPTAADAGFFVDGDDELGGVFGFVSS
jgi:hypothetical protein